MQYEVKLFSGRKLVRREIFTNYDCAMAFFDCNRDKYRCEFTDLGYYTNWRYIAA